MNFTVLDIQGRKWTIVTEDAAVGFRWCVYLHRSDCLPGALELLQPGGVAHGWTEDDHTEESVRALQSAMMAIKGANATARKHRDLGLTVDEAVARYRRQIADGPECAEYLRNKGFEAWRDMWWEHHARVDEERAGREWDSRNYDDAAMREIYDGIIEAAEVRREAP